MYMYKYRRIWHFVMKIKYTFLQSNNQSIIQTVTKIKQCDFLKAKIFRCTVGTVCTVFLAVFFTKLCIIYGQQFHMYMYVGSNCLLQMYILQQFLYF